MSSEKQPDKSPDKERWIVVILNKVFIMILKTLVSSAFGILMAITVPAAMGEELSQSIAKQLAEEASAPVEEQPRTRMQAVGAWFRGIPEAMSTRADGLKSSFSGKSDLRVVELEAQVEVLQEELLKARKAAGKATANNRAELNVVEDCSQTVTDFLGRLKVI